MNLELEEDSLRICLRWSLLTSMISVESWSLIYERSCRSTREKNSPNDSLLIEGGGNGASSGDFSSSLGMDWEMVEGVASN